MSAGLPPLPERLPDGEHILWRGRPDGWAMARRVFRLRGLAGYFAALLAFSAWHGLGSGATAADVALSTARFGALALVALAVVAGYAVASARATAYTVTSRRVVMRFGVALPMTINLPFTRVDGADFRAAADGTGDIPLLLPVADKLSYILLWPHARPWRLSRPQPMLRAVPDAARVAQILARALASANDVPAPRMQQLQPSSPGITIGASPQGAVAA